MVFTPVQYPYYGPVAHSSGTGNLPIWWIIIHCTAGSDAKGATGTAAYFRMQSAGGSAHFITDSDECIRCAADNVVCWHAPPNPHELGIEMECSLANRGQGHWTRADHIAMMKITAKLTAEKCVEYNIPPVKITAAQRKAGVHGVCGHWDVTIAFGQSTHTDPEIYFPWTQFMAWVKQEYDKIKGTTTPPPVVTGGLSMADAASIQAQITALENVLLNRYRRDEDTRRVILGAITAIATQIKGVDAENDAALAKAVADLKTAIDTPPVTPPPVTPPPVTPPLP